MMLEKKVSIPTIKCPPKCHRCCNPVFVTKIESEKLGLCGDNWTGQRPDGKCRFLGPNGCMVYDKRPMICRLFGTAESGVLECCFLPPQKVRLMTPQEQRLALEKYYMEAMHGGQLIMFLADESKQRHMHDMDEKEGFERSCLRLDIGG